jgi:hypothetical protein
MVAWIIIRHPELVMPYLLHARVFTLLLTQSTPARFLFQGSGQRLPANACPLLAGYDESFRYWVDVEMWFQLIASSFCVIVREPLGGFRVHRGAASCHLQGGSYAEFVRIAQRYGPPATVIRRTILQRLRAASDSGARLILYRIFG